MKRHSRKLASSLELRLNAYMLAASAAGVGMLALAQPAEAKIIYTKAHHVIGLDGAYKLDLAHDGRPAFLLTNRASTSTFTFGDFLGVEPIASGEGVWVTTHGDKFASALRAGVRVGAGSKWSRGNTDAMATWRYIRSHTISGGPWKNVRNRYLGLKFGIKGKVHYGWARLNVTIERDDVIATLTGYAYETIPNKPIIAGKTKGPDVITLGHLAAGALAAPPLRTDGIR